MSAGTKSPSRTGTATAPKQTVSKGLPSSLLKLPASLRHLFDTFPLITYEENDLPQRLNRDRTKHSLYIFTYPEDSTRSRLSPNPACLKWQAYLLTKRVPFQTIRSTNHASPNGALPYLQPGQVTRREPESFPIMSSKLQRWTESQTKADEPQDFRLDAYLSLIDQDIRNAWLYYLYLNKQNFEAVAEKIYITPASHTGFVTMTLAYQLRCAAKEQLQKTTIALDQDDILESADAAFRSLNTLLGTDNFFSRKDTPGLFDCTLFAYTQPLLALGQNQHERTMKWADDRLMQKLLPYTGIVRHVQNMLQACKESNI